MARSAAAAMIPKGKRVDFRDLPEDAQRASRAISKLWEEESDRIARKRVDFADLTAESVTVGEITLPIPSALADDIIKQHLKGPNIKEVKTIADISHDMWQWIATTWWILDHQYDRDENGRPAILRFKREPKWRPLEEELDEYLFRLDYGPRVIDFYAAYRTASSLENAEERRKKVQTAMQTGRPQKIAVLRPYISQ